MTSQLPCFGCLPAAKKNTWAAVTSLRSFSFRDDFSYTHIQMRIHKVVGPIVFLILLADQFRKVLIPKRDIGREEKKSV